jgi:Tol biopolymer transport system component
LYKAPVLGGVPQKLVSGVGNVPTISPDEARIAFVRYNEQTKTSSIVVAGLDGSGSKEISVRPGVGSISSLGLAWSPDSRSIAFGATVGEADQRELFVVDPATGNEARLTSSNWLEIARVEWLKDQSGLLVVGRDKGTAAVVLTQIWEVTYPSGVVRPVTGDISKYGSALGVSKDSDRLLAVRSSPEGNIWIADSSELAAAKQVTFGSPGRQDGWNGLDWRPDGRILYTAFTDQSSAVWVMNADGTAPTQITSNGFRDRHVDSSSDGRLIAFESNRSADSEIWLVNIDGSGLRRLTQTGGNSSPSLTPDGKSIIYQHSGDDGDSIWRISSDGGEPRRLTSGEANNPGVSPDGRFVACGYRDKEKIVLAVIPIEGGEPVKVFDVPSTYNFDNTAIRWSPDGKLISYRDWANGIWQQSIEGGEPKRLAGLPEEKLYTYAWSPDGRRFAFVRGREIRDAVLMTNFR